MKRAMKSVHVHISVRVHLSGLVSGSGGQEDPLQRSSRGWQFSRELLRRRRRRIGVALTTLSLLSKITRISGPSSTTGPKQGNPGRSWKTTEAAARPPSFRRPSFLSLCQRLPLTSPLPALGHPTVCPPSQTLTIRPLTFSRIWELRVPDCFLLQMRETVWAPEVESPGFRALTFWVPFFCFPRTGWRFRVGFFSPPVYALLESDVERARETLFLWKGWWCVRHAVHESPGRMHTPEVLA